MNYQKPNLLCYRIAQLAAWFVSTFVFQRKNLRNEIRDKKGPFVVIANHGAALDFVNLIGLTRRPMSFVISNSFFNTLPVKGFLKKIGVIPKQQFQTTADDLKRIKAVIRNGQPVVIYPAGLMCEDGLSTPIPTATYKFIKWLDADVYVARSRGAYFVMPKWAKGFRPGRTTIDVYRLFSREALAAASLDTVREDTDRALLFDAYREQAEAPVRYRNNKNVEGLENVLYMCPNCHQEFSMENPEPSTLRCSACGYTQTADRHGIFHKQSEVGAEIPFVSDWSKLIYGVLQSRIEEGLLTELKTKVELRMIDYSKNRFVPVGSGMLELSKDGFLIDGEIRGEAVSITVPIAGIPTLPFSPGKHLEVQHGSEIYRCVPEDGRLVMKFINMLKIFFVLNRQQLETARSRKEAVMQ